MEGVRERVRLVDVWEDEGATRISLLQSLFYIPQGRSEVDVPTLILNNPMCRVSTTQTLPSSSKDSRGLIQTSTGLRRRSGGRSSVFVVASSISMTELASSLWIGGSSFASGTTFFLAQEVQLVTNAISQKTGLDIASPIFLFANLLSSKRGDEMCLGGSRPEGVTAKEGENAADRHHHHQRHHHLHRGTITILWLPEPLFQPQVKANKQCPKYGPGGRVKFLSGIASITRPMNAEIAP